MKQPFINIITATTIIIMKENLLLVTAAKGCLNKSLNAVTNGSKDLLLGG